MLDREKILEDFKIDKKNKKEKIVKRNISDGTLNCLEMGMAFLRNEKDLSDFNSEMITDFIEAIANIWEPAPNQEEERRKEATVAELKNILPLLQKEIAKYIVKEKAVVEKTN